MASTSGTKLSSSVDIYIFFDFKSLILHFVTFLFLYADNFQVFPNLMVTIMTVAMTTVAITAIINVKPIMSLLFNTVYVNFDDFISNINWLILVHI